MLRGGLGRRSHDPSGGGERSRAAERGADVGRGVHALPQGVRLYAVCRRPAPVLHVRRERLCVPAGTFVDDYKAVVQSEPLAARLNEEWEKKFSDPPDVDAVARDFLGLRYGTAPAGMTEIGCGKALGDLGDKLAWVNLNSFGFKCTTPLPEEALHQLEARPGTESAPFLDSAIPLARGTPGLRGSGSPATRDRAACPATPRCPAGSPRDGLPSTRLTGSCSGQPTS